MTPFLRSWLAFFHKWIGYPAGLVLFILFFSGTLASFSAGLQQWMEPQTALNNAPLTEKGIEQAEKLFAQSLQDYPNSFLRLPTRDDPVIRIWHFDGHNFLGPALNPTTGAVIPTRNHVGGLFFVTLHSDIRLPAFYGALIGLFAFIGLVIASITGLWMHWKLFFSDLLLFRPQAPDKRKLLDLHLLIGCVIFPVLMVIGFSGACLDLHQLGLIGHHHSKKEAPALTYQSLPPLSPIIAKGQEEWHNLEGSFFLDTPEGLHFIRGDESQFCSSRPFISTEGKHSSSPSQPCTFHALLHGVHKIRWAHGALRWCIALIGLIGATLTGSGLIFFYKAELHKQGKNQSPPGLSCRFYKALNDGTIMGLPFATLGLLGISRLPAPPFMEVYQWENLAFFSLWGGCYLLSFIAGTARSFLPYLLMIAGFGLLPLDIFTRPFFSPGSVTCLIIDGCAILAGLAAFSSLNLRKGRNA
ncbi:PepSY-associated TM helix domain-containing protein [Acetobacteraceae bacterium ESL0709]|nr:PepSY-associated TM helix domain-containing protein [Acetobacteraceae bacterium ESL0697]MDF7677793.1 PepSY-associated TM helix domain-containing protein [Acetobacteraceae bacterium ESL0709]